MATDHAASVDAEADVDVDPGSTNADAGAYVSPAADFLLVFAVCSATLLGVAVVMTP